MVSFFFLQAWDEDKFLTPVWKRSEVWGFEIRFFMKIPIFFLSHARDRVKKKCLLGICL